MHLSKVTVRTFDKVSDDVAAFASFSIPVKMPELRKKANPFRPVEKIPMVPYKQVDFSTVDDAVTRVGWHTMERLKEVSSWSKQNVEHPSIKHINAFKVTEFADVSEKLAMQLREVFDDRKSMH